MSDYEGQVGSISICTMRPWLRISGHNHCTVAVTKALNHLTELLKCIALTKKLAHIRQTDW